MIKTAGRKTKAETERFSLCTEALEIFFPIFCFALKVFLHGHQHCCYEARLKLRTPRSSSDADAPCTASAWQRADANIVIFKSVAIMEAEWVYWVIPVGAVPNKHPKANYSCCYCEWKWGFFIGWLRSPSSSYDGTEEGNSGRFVIRVEIGPRNYTSLKQTSIQHALMEPIGG